MEERLFFIGLTMGAYAWASRRFVRSQTLDTPAKTGLWHSLFCALAGFSVMMVLMISLESRSKFMPVSTGAFPAAQLYPSAAVAVIAAVIGFWRGRSAASEVSKSGYYLSEDMEWSETVFSAVLLASVLMYFVVQAFKIPSGSMERTLLVGDHLFVNKFIYGLKIPLTGKRIFPLRQVRRGDIVVFRFPVGDPREVHCGAVQYGKDFIKRVIALPGENVQVSAGRVFVNGRELSGESYAQYLDGPNRQPESVRSVGLEGKRYQELWQNHVLDHELQEIQRDYFGPVVVPVNSYYVMGDNRDRSCDSRYWGPVEAKNLKGKAWFIYWPPSRMGLAQ